MKSIVGVATATVIAIGLSIANPALSQLRTELRDPIRGVSFHSIELSELALNSLNVLEGRFSDSDELAIGLSVMRFESAESIDEYVLWIRHQGRRWLDFERESPIAVRADGEILPLIQVRAAVPFVGAAGRFFEKAEFSITKAELGRLVESESATITLRSDNGIVEKQLTQEELENLNDFLNSLASAGTAS